MPKTATISDEELNDRINASHFHDSAIGDRQQAEAVAELDRLNRERREAFEREWEQVGAAKAKPKKNGKPQTEAAAARAEGKRLLREAEAEKKRQKDLAEAESQLEDLGLLSPRNGTSTLHGAASDPARAPAAHAGDKAAELVPIAKIAASQTNPREDFDTAKLRELADSIRAHGVLQPLQVRRLPNRGHYDQYELIAGERRLRAAELAGLDLVPCVIRGQDRDDALTPVKILEIQVLENEQREDLNPLEKARGYKQLVDAGAKVEDLAKRLGKSTGTIYGFLKLLDLPVPALKALAAGDLPAITAQLIARIPDPKAKADAAKQILAGDWRNKDEPLSYRRSLELIREHYTCELKKAPFSRERADLVPSAGACTSCPKRSGNNPEYADSRADICTDPSCYREKVEEHKAELIRLQKAAGRTVVSGKQADKIFDRYGGTSLSYDSGYVDLKEQCHEGKYRGQSYKKLLNGKVKDAEIIVAVDKAGQVHELVDKKKARKLLGIQENQWGGVPKRLTKEELAKARAANAKRRAKEDRILTEAAAAGRQLPGKISLGCSSVPGPISTPAATETAAIFRHIITADIERLGQLSLEAICRRRQLKGHGTTDRRNSLHQLTKDLDAPALIELWIELRAATALIGWGGNGQAFAKALGVSLKG